MLCILYIVHVCVTNLFPKPSLSVSKLHAHALKGREFWRLVQCTQQLPLMLANFIHIDPQLMIQILFYVCMQHSDNRCTVFVTNVQHHFGDQDLQELFQQVLFFHSNYSTTYGQSACSLGEAWVSIVKNVRHDVGCNLQQ